MRRFIYERSATNIHDWAQAYSFIYATRIGTQLKTKFGIKLKHKKNARAYFVCRGTDRMADRQTDRE